MAEVDKMFTVESLLPLCYIPYALDVRLDEENSDENGLRFGKDGR